MLKYNINSPDELMRIAHEDPRWIIESGFLVTNKAKEIVPFIFNDIQNAFYDERTIRDDLLKPGQIGMCLDPSHRILTSDLKWVSLDKIKVGDKIVSTDEYPLLQGKGHARKMREGIIEAKNEVFEDAFEITLKSGKRIIATGKHRFMSRPPGGGFKNWRAVEKIKPGYSLRKITNTWGESTLDDRKGVTSKLGNKDIHSLTFSKMSTLFEILGRARPVRFVNSKFFEGKELPGKKIGNAWDEIVAIKSIGKRRMIDLQTSTKTFVVEGILSHNSTAILAILTVKFLMVPNAWCVCISHEAEATKRLFEKVDFFLTHLPDWLKPFYSPETDNKRNMVNGVMKSRFYIGTAGALAFGRGDTIHYAHLSEVSRWPNSGTIATGIIRAVPVNDPKTWVVKETTANGIGNFHQTEYQRAKDGDSEFTPHFFPWFDHKEYQIKGETIDNYDDEEMALIRAYGNKITDAKLVWRRKMVGSLNSEAGFTPEEMFKQEFPANDKEAFLFSGNPVFPTAKLELYRERAVAPIWTGNLQGIAPHEKLDETARGSLKLWEMPEAGEQYVIFGDVGQFVDFASAHIMNRKTWKIVGTFHARIKANQFGMELSLLGHFFNDALIAVEANNMGQSTVDRLEELSYPHLYMRQRLNKEEKTITDEFGWWTDPKTKGLMIGYLQELIRTEQAHIPDIATVDEMVTYIRTDNGGMEASKGNHDDRVISLAGVYYINKLMPLHVAQKKALPQGQSAASRFSKMRKQRTATGKQMGRGTGASTRWRK